MKKRAIWIMLSILAIAAIVVGCGVGGSQSKNPPTDKIVATQSTESTQSTEETQQVPAETRPPENLGDVEGIAVTQREAYDAFYAYLVAHENLILPYQQDLIFTGGGENYARNIMLADFNGDGLEDMLCVEKEEFDDSFHYSSKLHILSYENGGLRPILEDIFVVGAGGGTKYAWFTLADGSLASLHSTSDSSMVHVFTKYMVETDGSLRPIASLSVSTDAEGVAEYSYCANIIDQAQFEQELSVYKDNITLIIKNGPYEFDEIYRPYGAMEPVAMTYAEALEFLKPETITIDNLDAYLGEWSYGENPGIEASLRIEKKENGLWYNLQFFRLTGDCNILTPTSTNSASFTFNSIPGTITFLDDTIVIELEDRAIYGTDTVSQFLNATRFEFKRA